MKIIHMILYVFVMLHLHESMINSRYDHVCSSTNESVVKFRKKMIGQSISSAEALQICVADHIVSKNGILFDWPIDLCEFWVSSLFGPRTYQGVTKMHRGIDLAAVKGTLVKAAADGTVIQAQENIPGYGTLIEIKHTQGFITRYGHLFEMSVDVHQKVKQGDVIGSVGATGNARGQRDPSHLHFEVLLNKQNVDPLRYLYCAEVAFVEK